MRFEVAGAWTYQIGIASSAVTEDGRTRAAQETNEVSRTIAISPTAPRGARLSLMLNGLASAWLSHIGGIPRTEDGLCELLASFAKASMRWAAANGGETALTRLGTGEGAQPGSARLALTMSRYCAICSSTVAPGSVECVPDGIGCAMMRIYCESCGHLQIWRESLGPTGLPTAEIVGEPEFNRGEEMRKFLIRHRDAGVVFSE